MKEKRKVNRPPYDNNRNCKCCVHPELEKINENLADRVPYYKIGEEYGMSRMSVFRHKKNCLIPNLENGFREKKEVSGKDVPANVEAGSKLMEKLEILEEDAKRIQNLAEGADNYSGALMAIKEQSRLLELFIKFSAEARERERLKQEDWQKDWAEIKEILEDIFREYPELWERFKNECVSRRIVAG